MITAGELRALLELVDAANLLELEVERDAARVRIRRDPDAAPSLAMPGDAAIDSALTDSKLDASYVVISPWVGVFHPSITAGVRVAAGEPIGVVEALRMPHEVAAEIGGQVEEVLVQDGHVVEYGQALARIRAERE